MIRQVTENVLLLNENLKKQTDQQDNNTYVTVKKKDSKNLLLNLMFDCVFFYS